MADLTVIKKKLENYKSTLKQTSYDKENRKYLCSSKLEVFNFDNYKKQTNKTKKSFDALYLEHDKIYCVEFKNRNKSDIKNENIQGKYEDGINLLIKLLQSNNINIQEYEFYFFMVFNSRNEIRQYRERNIGNEIYFGLEEKRKNLKKINNIHNKIKIETNNVNYFSRKFKNILCGDFSC